MTSNSAKDNHTPLELFKASIDPGYSVPIEVEVNSKSGIIYDLQVEMGHDNKSAFQLKTHLPDVSDLALSTYVYFLRHYLTWLSANIDQPYGGQIIDRATLIDCLAIYRLTDDSNFFEFLLEQLFKRWTLLASKDARTTVRFSCSLR